MKQKRSLYILCGGQSSRMGRDKSQLLFRGQTFLELMSAKASVHFETLFLLGANRPFNTPIKQIPDARDDAGPLGGILAALQHTNQESVAILPVDLPLITNKTLRYLHEESFQKSDIIIAKSPDRIQPLLGIWKTALSAKLENYLNAGMRSVMGFLDEIDVETFEVTSGEIKNINTQEEYEKLLREHS